MWNFKGIFSSFRADKVVVVLHPRFHRGLFIYGSFRASWDYKISLRLTAMPPDPPAEAGQAPSKGEGKNSAPSKWEVKNSAPS